MELTELNLSEEQLQGVKGYLQSEGDKIRTKYNKEIKELKEKLPVEKDAETLAYEKEKADFKREKQIFELSKQLSDKGLNSKLADYLNVDGVEDLETYITDLNKLLGVKDFVPNKGHNGATGNITKEQFSKMNYMERQKLYTENKDLYNILSK